MSNIIDKIICVIYDLPLKRVLILLVSVVAAPFLLWYMQFVCKKNKEQNPAIIEKYTFIQKSFIEYLRKIESLRPVNHLDCLTENDTIPCDITLPIEKIRDNGEFASLKSGIVEEAIKLESAIFEYGNCMINSVQLIYDALVANREVFSDVREWCELPNNRFIEAGNLNNSSMPIHGCNDFRDFYDEEKINDWFSVFDWSPSCGIHFLHENSHKLPARLRLSFKLFPGGLAIDKKEYLSCVYKRLNEIYLFSKMLCETKRIKKEIRKFLKKLDSRIRKHF